MKAIGTALVITALALGLASGAGAQQPHHGESFTLNTTLNPAQDHEYAASRHIDLVPGFSSSPTRYRSTVLQIDPFGVFPPDEGTTDANGYVVGALGGTVDVGAMGGLLYSIPLDLPQGINGMQPALSVTYDSQAGNGLMGWGWRLSGLSSITRTGKTRYHDREKTAADLSWDDRFLLDGQRLIEVADCSDSIEFRTEHDAMSRIMAYVTLQAGGGLFGQGPVRIIERFKVWQADGLVMEYGATGSSRIEAQSGSPHAVCWLLDKVSDRDGNAVLYHYYENTPQGEYHVDTIRYTVNEGQQTPAQFTVSFQYSLGRQDCERHYIGGSMVTMRHLLNGVTVSTSPGHRPLRSYEFGYDDRAQNSSYQFLTTIGMTDYGEDGLPERIRATSVSWDNPDSQVLSYFPVTGQGILTSFPFEGDFNGDGYTDLAVVPYKNGTAYSAPVDVRVYLNDRNHGFEHVQTLDLPSLAPSLDWIHVLDIDGDGVDDLAACFYDTVPSTGTESTEVKVYRNNPASRTFSLAGSRTVQNKADAITGDFDGDGNTDVVLLEKTQGDITVGNNVIGTAPHLENAFFLGYTGSQFRNTRLNTGSLGNLGPVFNEVAADFNGDGITEVFMVGFFSSNLDHHGSWIGRFDPADGNHCLKSLQTFGSSLYPCNSNCSGLPWSHLFPGDFNGDGKDDLLYYYSNGWHICLSEGSGLGSPMSVMGSYLPHLGDGINLFYPSLRLLTSPETGNYATTVAVGDFDADGKADVAFTLMSESPLYFESKPYYNGSGQIMFRKRFISPSSMRFASQYIHKGNFLGRDNLSILGTEVPAGGSKDNVPGIFTLRSVSEYNSVTSVTDGLGNSTSFTYAYLMPGPEQESTPFYSFGYSAPDSDGIRPVPLPVMALETCTVEGVNGSSLVTGYHYRNALYHRDGHGFLGFAKAVVETRRNSASAPWLTRQVRLGETATMGRYATMLPQTDSAYINCGGTARMVGRTQYAFENAVLSSGVTDLVSCPAMIQKTEDTYSMDAEGVPLSTVFTGYQYDYGPGQNGVRSYNGAYGCIASEETVTGYGGNVSRTELWTVKAFFLASHFPQWTVNRPDSVFVSSARDGETVCSKTKYAYASSHGLKPSSVTVIPDNAAVSNDPLTITTQYSYDGFGNVTCATVSAPYGIHGETPRATHYEYGARAGHRLVTKVTHGDPSDGYATGYGYDFHDRLDSVSDPNGRRTMHSSSILGNDMVTSMQDGTERRVRTLWAGPSPYKPEGASYYTWEKTTGGATTMAFRHKSGALLRSVSFDLHGNAVFTDTRYNSDGLKWKESLPYRMGTPEEDIQWTVYHYDTHDRIVRIDAPDGSAVTYAYDGLTTTTVKTPAAGGTGLSPRSTVRTLNALGWLDGSVDADGVGVFYGYYPNGKLKWTRVGNDNATTVSMEYDHAGNRTSLHDPDYCSQQGDLVSVYDAFGQEVERTTPRQFTTTFAYDFLGRMTSRVEQDLSPEGSTVTRTTTWQYNETVPGKGLLQSVAYPGETVTFAYDTCQRVSSETVQFDGGVTYMTQYGYDRASRLASVTHPSGFTVKQRYSSEGYPSVQTDGQGHELCRLLETTPMGQPRRFATGGVLETTLGYHPLNHLLTGTETKKNGSTLQRLSFSYDGFCNLASRNDDMNDLGETFCYDSQDRLTEVWKGSVRTGTSAYDGYGRMTSKTADGQEVFSGAVFNAAGKPHAMEKAATPSGVFPAAPQTVTYTGFDKVLKVKQGNDSLCYAYGHDRRRIAMEEHAGNTVRTKRYVGSCEFVTETTGNTTASRWLTYLSGPTEVYAVVVTEDNENTVHYILKDNLGSWTAVADSIGTVEQRLSYDAWGNLRDPYAWSGSFTGSPMFDHGFTGHEHLLNFGLINMNGRMYDPMMSSFLSVDRFVQDPETAQGFNRYAYCGHNPLRYVDPSGWEMVKPVPGMTPNSADFYQDPHAFAERAYEPRDLGILQLPTSDPSVVWMEENEMHGVGKELDLEDSMPLDVREDPPKGVKIHTGNCLLIKAYWHYQFGERKNFWVDASTIDLDYISFKDLKKIDDETYWINLFDYSKTDQTALSLGKIVLIPLGDNRYEIKYDPYDFNIEWDQGWSNRNIGTLISGYLHGPVIDNTPIPTHWMDGRPCYAQPSIYFGGPFEIHFSGSVYIKP